MTGLLPEDEDDDEDEGAYNRVGRRQRRYKRDVTDDEAASCTNCGVQTGLHIVYKRQDHGEHAGDYGKQLLFTFTAQRLRNEGKIHSKHFS